MKYLTSLLAALFALTVFTRTLARADNMASLAIAPSSGAVTLVPQWAIGGNLAGFHFMTQDLSLGGGPNQFYSIKGTSIPAGGDISAFNIYSSASGATTAHADIGSKLTPNSYSALSSADPDLGFGAIQLYFIHHKTDGDYFSHIVPSSGTASAVTDLKPMSQPGGPATGGASGYFGLTFSATDLGYGANLFYYLRTNTVTGFTKFGSLVPALAGSSTDQFDLGLGGHNALAYTGTDVGFGINQMYYLRLDPITGFTIFGTLHPGTGRASDVANLGSVYSTLTYVAGDAGFGASRFYTTGAVNPTWQSVSFAAIADRAITTGAFTVSPSTSSGLAVTLTVVPGSIGAASITGPSAGVFTVTPTAPGRITLQATQAGQVGPTAYEFNMLRQSFTATGLATLAITTQPTSQIAATGNTANFSVTASGTTSLSYQWRKAGAAIGGNASALTSTLTLANVQSSDAAVYDVVVTNTSGSLISDPVTLTATTAAPIVTNSPLTAGGTTGASFSFTITASGSPTSYSASPLPTGLIVNTATGAITGTPTTAGITSVLLGATNGTGTGNATLTLTVTAAGVAPIVTNNPLSAAGTVGSTFNFTITASGSPTSFSGAPLPAGLSISSATGAITGTPTTVGTTLTVLGATNATGTGTATLTITVSAAGVAPIVTNNPLTSPGTVGSPYSFAITASGSPTSYSASGLPAGLTVNIATGAISGTPTIAGTSVVTIGVSNAFGSGAATLTITVAAASVAPVITSPTTAVATAGTPFVTYFIAATGLPTSYNATGLPAGLSLNTLTGAINGTPTSAGVSVVTLTVTNSAGVSTATLTITIAAASVAPIITSPTTAPGTVGTAFATYLIAATGLPTSYNATGLPAGLSLDTLTGAINGTPTSAGVSVVTLTATNSAGVSTATLTITIAAASVAPIITSPTTAPGTVGTVFATYLIAATGLPTNYNATGLPTGLSLNTLTGAINGMPTSAGVSVVTLTATNSAGVSTATLTITIAAATVAPIITSPTTAPGTVGTPFITYLIAATGLPTNYNATGLPTGLSLNTLTGAINGTPTSAGVSVVTLTATNSAGVSTATLTITIAAATVAPIITSSTTAPGTVGTPFATYLIAATGLPTSYTATGLPAGLTLNSVTGAINGTPTSSGAFVIALTATNSAGASTATLTITIAPAAVAPVITSPPTAPATAGAAFPTYVIAATGLPTSFSATGLPAGLTLNPQTGAINGTPTVPGTFVVTLFATNATGTNTTTLTIVIAAAPSSRIVNFSARALSGPGNETLIMGFVVAGDGKNLLVRGIGPTLAAFGVLNSLADPMLTLYGSTGAIATNDDWQTNLAGPSNAALIASTAIRVGAFALGAGSKDSALLSTFHNGSHTTSMLRPNSTTGIAMTEIYDTDTTATARLINVSARMNVSTGEGTLIAGFVIAGNVPKTVLIRGSGPSLSAFGVSNVLADPKITVFTGATLVATNDNWEAGLSTSAEIIAASSRVGAFPLAAGGKDAALLLTLQPGAYTVQVVGVGTPTGVALVEVYDAE